MTYISNVTVTRIGTDLYIEATRVNGWYTATVRYRYRPLSGGSYSEWKTILEKESATQTVSITESLGLSANESYVVVVGTLDNNGHESNTTIIVPADGVFMEKDGEMNSVSIGEPVSERDTVSIGEKQTVKVRKKIVVGTGVDEQSNHAAELAKDYFKIGGYPYDSINDKVPYYEVVLDKSETGHIGQYLDERTSGGIWSECGTNHENVNMSETTYFSRGYGVHYGHAQLVVGCIGGRARVTGLTEPVDDTDAVNKAYVESLLASIYQELNAIKTALSNQ